MVDGTAPTNAISGQALTFSKFGAVSASTAIDITCTYVLATEATTATVKLVETLVSYDVAGGNMINEWVDNNLVVTIDSTAQSVGTSSDLTVNAMPDNINATSADVHLKFKVSKALPKGTKLSVKFPSNLTKVLSGNIKDSCWSKSMYTGCNMNNSQLELDLGEDVAQSTNIEIYVNKGWSLPSTVTVSSDVFQITAVFSTVTIIGDAATVVSDKTFTASAAMASTISGNILAMSNNNAGEVADYTFTFKSSTGYAVTESIEIYFPNAFDPFVGMASKWFMNEPSTYYINCSSTALSLVWCTVDKWKVTIMGSSAVEAANDIDITLKYVMNPT